MIAICLRKVSPEIREVVEKELLKAAESCDPSELRRFCREVRSRLGADESAEAAEFSLTAGQLPDHGGEKPQVVTVVPFADLTAKLQNSPAHALMNGLEISISTARMMACDAGIIPAVLGSHGEVLDLGRKQPTWNVAQRRALRVEDRGCRFPGCKTGLNHCQAHHIQHWAHEGRTDVANGVHLCRFHHWLVHHSDWQIEKNHRNQIRVWRT